MIEEIIHAIVWSWFGAFGARLYMRHYYHLVRKDQVVDTTIWDKEGKEILHWEKGEEKE